MSLDRTSRRTATLAAIAVGVSGLSLPAHAQTHESSLGFDIKDLVAPDQITEHIEREHSKHIEALKNSKEYLEKLHLAYNDVQKRLRILEKESLKGESSALAAAEKLHTIRRAYVSARLLVVAKEGRLITALQNFDRSQEDRVSITRQRLLNPETRRAFLDELQSDLVALEISRRELMAALAAAGAIVEQAY